MRSPSSALTPRLLLLIVLARPVSPLPRRPPRETPTAEKFYSSKAARCVMPPDRTRGRRPDRAAARRRGGAAAGSLSRSATPRRWPVPSHLGSRHARPISDRPDTLVPGTNMVIPVANPADRADLIAFLATLRPVAAPTKEELAAAAVHAAGPGDWQNDAPWRAPSHRPEKPGGALCHQVGGQLAKTVDRPAGASLAVPPGFQVRLFASGLSGPRLLRTAPNGDIFIAETRQGRIRGSGWRTAPTPRRKTRFLPKICAAPSASPSIP